MDQCAVEWNGTRGHNDTHATQLPADRPRQACQRCSERTTGELKLVDGVEEKGGDLGLRDAPSGEPRGFCGGEQVIQVGLRQFCQFEVERRLPRVAAALAFGLAFVGFA